jgi:uncharacterized protein (TIGR03032 family)
MAKRDMTKREEAWARQDAAMRDPAEIVCGAYAANGVRPASLAHRASPGFVRLLKRLKITLLVSREYEHLVFALSASGGRLRQSFVHLPHPSGIAVDAKRNSVFIAATRNPNAIWEFKSAKGGSRALVPVRAKFLPGSTYMHDLAMIGGRLHANSVGQNAIIRVNMERAEIDAPIWWPKCVEKNGKPEFRRNHIQLNSIAAGKTLAESFFSASGEEMSARRPGHLNYPVEGRGVIMSGKTRGVAVRGLTRPHSARIANGRLWVDNSGSGEFGFVSDGAFCPLVRLPGWTRGLCIIDRVAFVGVSRILPRFRHYAPGLKGRDGECGIYAVDLRNGKILGKLIWPNGNQIFAIDRIASNVATGFPFTDVKSGGKSVRDLFYRYAI